MWLQLTIGLASLAVLGWVCADLYRVHRHNQERNREAEERRRRGY